MHLYHHTYRLPEDGDYVVNFGISLSVWDYIIKTNYVPEENGTIELGYLDDDKMTKNFVKQLVYGFKKTD